MNSTPVATNANLNNGKHDVIIRPIKTNIRLQSKAPPLKCKSQIDGGRLIPTFQGYLRKKKKSGSKHKKFVALTSDGYLSYYPKKSDYSCNERGTFVDLRITIVKSSNPCPSIQSSPDVNQSMSYNTGSHSTASASNETLHSDSNVSSENAYVAYDVKKDDDIKKTSKDKSNNSTVPTSKSSKSEIPCKLIHKCTNSKLIRKFKNVIHSDKEKDYEIVLINPIIGTLTFVAPNQFHRETWVTAIKNAMQQSTEHMYSKTKSMYEYSNTSPNKLDDIESNLAEKFQTLDGNETCADCGAVDPEWASLNLGVLICIECSGVHREFGSHISRVRSLLLDNWSELQISTMMAFGNGKVNSLWEACVDDPNEKPNATSSREMRTAWIKHKYIDRKYVPTLAQCNKPTKEKLIECVTKDSLCELLLCIHHLKDDDFQADSDSRTPLHYACMLDKPAAVQMLIWHGTDVNKTDQWNLNAWSYANDKKHTECVKLLEDSGSQIILMQSVTKEMSVETLLEFQSSLNLCPPIENNPRRDSKCNLKLTDKYENKRKFSFNILKNIFT